MTPFDSTMLSAGCLGLQILQTFHSLYPSTLPFCLFQLSAQPFYPVWRKLLLTKRIRDLRSADLVSEKEGIPQDQIPLRLAEHRGLLLIFL